MLKIVGYELKDQIFCSERTTVYRGHRESDGLPVVVKLLNDELPSADVAARFKREYELGRVVSGRGAVEILSMEQVRSTRAIVMADMGGRSLFAHLAGGRLSLEEALSLGARAAAALAEIHAARVIHKDVNPSNIVLDPTTSRVRFIDFGLSTALPRETPSLHPLNVLEGTLRYISPEQTGRMNRSVDLRTDLYSLGVTLYEMLTGRVPFAGDDPMELVHLHLAQRPVPPHSADPAIPPAVSGVVMKLLAKTAEDRYQSALGLVADLEACLASVRTGTPLEGFTPGRLDSSDRFQLPQQLYGREAQVASVLDTFERAARGRAELMLVAGYSGVGKSVLVNEIHKPVLARRGYFVAGKFDQLQRDVPYASLIQALSELIRQLLTEPEQRLAGWRRSLTEALGESGHVIVDMIPNVERIVGPQPPVPALPPTEAQNRFNLVFLRFITALAAEAHPLALFLDDLQWADLASLKLIELLLTEPGLGHLLLIGAYRDNEVLDSHPLRMTLQSLERAGARVTTLSLAPLELPHVEALVAATLHDGGRASALLAALLYERTGGNPFFLRQLLQALHDDGLIAFDPEARGWRWEFEAIRARGLTDGVAELMVRKIQKLPAHTQEVLRIAASIGNRFDLATLAVVQQRSPAQTVADLYPAMEESLVLPLDERWELAEQGGGSAGAYRFLHDRVQQAAYSLIAEGDRPELHLRIGRLLLASTATDQREERLFDVVNQLDLGAAGIETPAERLALCRLNLEAGKKARASAAYEPAHRYLEMGLRLLPAGSFTAHHELAFDLHAEAVETAYLDTDYARAEELSQVALKNAATALEKLRIHEIRMLFHSARLQFPETIEVGTEALRLLESNLSMDVDFAGAMAAVGATAALLGDRPIAALAELPEMTDPAKLATLRILVSLSAPVYGTRPLAFMPLVCEMVNLCVTHGNSALSAFAWADYAVVRCALGDVDGGNELGTLALALLDRFDTRTIRAKVLMIVCSYVRPWKAHLRDSFELLLEAIRGGLEVGDVEFVGYSAVVHGAALLQTGEPLEVVARELRRYRDLMNSLKLEYARLGIDIYRQSVQNLIGPVPDPVRLAGELFDEAIELPRLVAAHADNNVSMLHVETCTLACMFRDHAAAVTAAVAAEPYMIAQTGHATVARHNFYQSLALLGAARTADEPTRAAHLAKVDQNQAQMKRWSDHAPMNYRHKHALVEAERARIRGAHLEAMALFEEAAAGAAAARYTPEEALSHELAGELYHALGRHRLAHDSLLDAANAYRRWGAEAKVDDLQRRYPEVFMRAAGSPRMGGGSRSLSNSPSSTDSNGSALDLATVLKAAEAISREIVLDRLLDNLMRITLENAGAQRGALLLEKDERPSIAAQRTVEAAYPGQAAEPLEGGELLTSAIVQYVARTRESVVLNDALAEGLFTADPYVMKHRPRSVLCAPLVNQGKLVAIVHLENNLTAGAFTADRIEVLRLLSAQAALSIQNALLYARLEEHSRTLEHRVADRTRELVDKNAELGRTLEQLRLTQKQLVSQEKLASLGALTAGVAHEIKNPLNFVTNFAELSGGLAEELADGLAGQRDKLAVAVADDFAEGLAALRDNLQKISEHGHRANRIIDGMLMHARETPGAREPADLNRLVADSIVLVYPGIRGKAAGFDVAIDAHYDPSVGLVELASAEISRVFVNLLNNACYAVLQKQAGNAAFTPRLTVRTRDLGDRIEVRVHDNGTGIPKAIRSKLFTPFFTTKPAGEGTGLGLSISHDIVVGHQGSVKIESIEGEFTEIVVDLPKRSQNAG